MSDTPRTDKAALDNGYIGRNVDTSFARQLERELAEANQQLAAAREEIAQLTECVSAPDSDGYWWMLDTHLPVRWVLVRVVGKTTFRVDTQTETQPPRCCSRWRKINEPQRR